MTHYVIVNVTFLVYPVLTNCIQHCVCKYIFSFIKHSAYSVFPPCKKCSSNIFKCNKNALFPNSRFSILKFLKFQPKFDEYFARQYNISYRIKKMSLLSWWQQVAFWGYLSFSETRQIVSAISFRMKMKHD